MPFPLTRRAGALAGIGAPACFIGAWVIAGAQARDYSPVHDFISDLARVHAPTRPLMTAGFLGFSALAPFWARTVAEALSEPRLRASIGAATIGTLGVAASPLGASWGDGPHAASAAIAYVGMAATPLLAAGHLSPGLARLSRVTGVASGLMLAGSMLGSYDGLLQRAGLGVVDAWFIGMAVRELRR